MYFNTQILMKNDDFYRQVVCEQISMYCCPWWIQSLHPRSLCSVIIRCCLVGGCVRFARQWLVYSQAAKDTYPLRHALSYWGTVTPAWGWSPGQHLELGILRKWVKTVSVHRRIKVYIPVRISIFNNTNNSVLLSISLQKMTMALVMCSISAH